MIRYKLPDNLYDEIDSLEAVLACFSVGKIDGTAVKAHRVPFGVYEQRTKDTYMLRVRTPGGIITPDQLSIAARAALKYGRKTLHITTRQEFQIHDLPLGKIAQVMRTLAAAGLSSRGGGGNTVRNITSSVNSGISKDEVFDVEPYVLFLTDYMISDSASWSLPRKFKISVSNAPDDTAYASANDLGFIAEIREGVRGFRVFTAGGMGARPFPGKLLYEFIPESEMLNVAVAVRNMFDKYGNRKNRNQARLKFLWEKLGGEIFRCAVEEERNALNGSLPPLLVRDIENGKPCGITSTPVLDLEGFDKWKSLYVFEQKQEGYFYVKVPVELGDIEVNTAAELAAFIGQLGDNVLRFTLDQNIVLRNIPTPFLGDVYSFLKSRLLVPAHSLYGSIVSCSGASTCQLGICLSRGAATALSNRLELNKIDFAGAGDVKIKISGCPNSCGQHWVADLGFFGTAQRKGNRVYPAYNVVAGSEASSSGFNPARRVGDVSARDLPEFVKNVFDDFRTGSGENTYFKEYLQNGGIQKIETLLKERYSHVPDFNEDKNYYFDWGSDELFSVTKRCVGECSAGVFDFIERDLKKIESAVRDIDTALSSDNHSVLSDILFYSARMLLITRGIEVSDRHTIISEFTKHFVDTGLISGRYESILLKKEIGLNDKDEVLAFSAAVLELYESMDDSLNIKPSHTHAVPATFLSYDSKEVIFKDLRGVACPMNFVKTKAELSKLAPGGMLQILLDEGAPIQNVPGSVRGEGHAIVREEKTGHYWTVVIRKA